MTMQTTHSPKPKIFGKGYGKHVAYNYKLMKRFFWLGWKMLVNMFIPAAFYERAHWEVIEMYHKMRGYRHGTVSDHRCDKCGGELLTCDESFDRRNELKDIERDCLRIDLCNHALDQMGSEDEYVPARMSDKEKEKILELMDAITDEEVEAEIQKLDEDTGQRIGEIEHPDHIGHHSIDHK